MNDQPPAKRKSCHLGNDLYFNKTCPLPFFFVSKKILVASEIVLTLTWAGPEEGVQIEVHIHESQYLS